MNRVYQSQEDLKKHLDEQLRFLSASADAYDRGNTAEAKRIATTVRVLLHDTGKSKSLLTQLGIKENLDFYDSGIIDESGGICTGASLVVIPGSGGNAIPFLDESPPETSGRVKFAEYWKRHVLTTGDKNFTREDLVIDVANTDGGAHVDPKLNEQYANLSRKHSFGWQAGTSEKSMIPVGSVELASIRQIGHELLRTLVREYPHKALPHRGSPLLFPRVTLKRVSPEDRTG